MFLKTDGAGNLSFDSLSFSTPLAVIGNATSGSEIRLPEDTDNGSNYVALKAPDTLSADLTLTLPSADGTSGQVLQTNGSGVLSFAGVSTDIKAWVNFNGTGTVAIRASFNVSSITDNGTGETTINFTNALTDTNYAISTGVSRDAVIGNDVGFETSSGAINSSSAKIKTHNATNANGIDYPFVYASIFR